MRTPLFCSGPFRSLFRIASGADPRCAPGLVLEVDRLVPLDMTEGSWISLDVSPDGEDGSYPVEISKGASNRAESPEWMPDGDYVVAAMGAFRLSGLSRLKLFHVDGGSGIELISEPDNLKTLGPAVSPEGRYIWYSRRTGDWQYNAQLPQDQVEVYDVETGERYPRSSRYGSALRAHPVAGRAVAGLRHAARRAHGAGAARSGDGGGALAGLSRAARRPGVAGDPGRAAGHVVHA